MKIKPGICSIFFKSYTLEIILEYLQEIEAQSESRFPAEFDTCQGEAEGEESPEQPVCDHDCPGKATVGTNLNHGVNYKGKTMM